VVGTLVGVDAPFELELELEPLLLEPQALMPNAISTDTAKMAGTLCHPVRPRTSFTALRLVRRIV
jgi:hypothetical protein